MSSLPSFSPPLVHQLKNSRLPVALGSGIMPSAARPSRPPPPVEPEAMAVGAAMASVGVEADAAGAVVSVGAAAAAVVLVAAGSAVLVDTGVEVAVSPPQADKTGKATTASAATHATRDFRVIIQ